MQSVCEGGVEKPSSQLFVFDDSKPFYGYIDPNKSEIVDAVIRRKAGNTKIPLPSLDQKNQEKKSAGGTQTQNKGNVQTFAPSPQTTSSARTLSVRLQRDEDGGSLR